MMLLQDLFAELRKRIHSGVNLPRQLLLGRSQGFHNLAERRVTYNKYIHVTAATLLSAGHRAIDESNLDLAAWPRQGAGKNFNPSHGLQHQTLDFLKYRALKICLIEHVPVAGSTFQNSGAP